MYSYDRNQLNFQYALNNFQKARRIAAMQEIVSRITGSEMSLLQYEEIRKQLKAIERSGLKTEVIPLKAIIGSVNRYEDFTRTFLPRTNSTRERWVGVMEGAAT